MTNLRRSIFYLQQELRANGDNEELLKALDILCKVDKDNNKYCVCGADHTFDIILCSECGKDKKPTP